MAGAVRMVCISRVVLPPPRANLLKTIKSDERMTWKEGTRTRKMIISVAGVQRVADGAIESVETTESQFLFTTNPSTPIQRIHDLRRYF